jgi:DNA-binding transcriptional ArsR family regulator
MLVATVRQVADRSEVLNRAFHALSDPSRRQMLDQLAGGPASVSDLAQPLRMTFAAVLQHVQVLEGSGLIASHKTGRVRTCSLNEQALRRAEQWLTDRRAVWERRLDRLAAVLDEDAMPDARSPIRKRGRRP